MTAGSEVLGCGCWGACWQLPSGAHQPLSFWEMPVEGRLQVVASLARILEGTGWESQLLSVCVFLGFLVAESTQR